MGYPVLPMVALLTFAAFSCSRSHNVTLDQECDMGIRTQYTVLLLIQTVSGRSESCTGAIVSPSVVVTTGSCCHRAWAIDVMAFYDFEEGRWAQHAAVESTNVLRREEISAREGELCVLKLHQTLDLEPIANSLEVYKDHLIEDSTMDVIAFIRTEVNDTTSFTVACRFAEKEEISICAKHYLNHTRFNFNLLNRSCMTNPFVNGDSCMGVEGAVVQHENRITGIVELYLEDCVKEKYGFYHDLTDHRDFINMVQNNRGIAVRYTIGTLLFTFLAVQTLIINTFISCVSIFLYLKRRQKYY